MLSYRNNNPIIALFTVFSKNEHGNTSVGGLKG